ncbi:AAA family ATPase [Flavobacterium pectinovorum]|nr:AAA family ATPase [Flavobacterium pectinovorum]
MVAESKGDRIEYKNVNKTLGLFAEEALRNYKASTNTSTESNIEFWIDSNFEDFKLEIEKQVEENEIILSGDITLFKVESDNFRYGKNWDNPSRINFIDFKNLVKAIIEGKFKFSNQQIPKEFSVHAHYRYTYYNALLKRFIEKYNYKGESYSEPSKNFILIIDEINRANLSSVLGEMIYALEYRGEAVESMYNVNGKELILPPNLYIIGTMNTADRSVGHIDYAIRRRFAFVDVLPENLKETQGLETFDDILFNNVTTLFDTNLSSEFEKKDVQLGHSYFIDKSNEKDGAPMFIRLEFEIKPILREYLKDGVLVGEDIKDKIDALAPSI